MDRVKAKRAEIKNQRGEQVQVDDDHCFAGFDGYKKVIESADVVLIANAAKFHPFHTMAAIRAGKHVFTEKPHGIDPAGMKLMKAACDSGQGKEAERRFRPAQPVSSRLHRDHSTHSRRRHRRHRFDRGKLPALALWRDRARPEFV